MLRGRPREKASKLDFGAGGGSETRDSAYFLQADLLRGRPREASKTDAGGGSETRDSVYRRRLELGAGGGSETRDSAYILQADMLRGRPREASKTDAGGGSETRDSVYRRNWSWAPEAVVKPATRRTGCRPLYFVEYPKRIPIWTWTTEAVVKPATRRPGSMKETLSIQECTWLPIREILGSGNSVITLLGARRQPRILARPIE